LENYFVPLKKCKHGWAYRIRSRNLGFGVFNSKTRGFVGIREKFGRTYLFEEYHADTGAPYGTVHPIRPIEKCPLPDIRDGCGDGCAKCDADIKFVKDDPKADKGQWIHVKKTDCTEASAVVRANKPLYEYLEKLETREAQRPCINCGDEMGWVSDCYTCHTEICGKCFNKTHGYCLSCMEDGRGVVRAAKAYLGIYEAVAKQPKKLLAFQQKKDFDRVLDQCDLELRMLHGCKESLFKAVDLLVEMVPAPKNRTLIKAIQFRETSRGVVEPYPATGFNSKESRAYFMAQMARQELFDLIRK